MYWRWEKSAPDPHFKILETAAMHIQNLPASALTGIQFSNLNIARTNKPSATIKVSMVTYFG